MHEKIQLFPGAADLGEYQIDRMQVFHIAPQDQARADAFRERPHAATQRFALIGEGQRRAFAGQRLGDPPRNRVVVRDPHHEPALPLHQLIHAAHPLFLGTRHSGSASERGRRRVARIGVFSSAGPEGFRSCVPRRPALRHRVV